MRLSKNKKAQTGTEPTELGKVSIIYPVVIILLVVDIAAMMILGANYMYLGTKGPDNLEDVFVTSRMLNTAECFAYQDIGTDRVYPHMIEFRKFTQERIDACLQLSDNDPCYTVKLLETTTSGSTTKMWELKTDNNDVCTASDTTAFRSRLVNIRYNDGSTMPGIIKVIKYHNS